MPRICAEERLRKGTMSTAWRRLIRLSRITGGEKTGCRLSVVGCRQNRSEEHTSELQSQSNIVCRLLLEKKQSMRHIGSGGEPGVGAVEGIEGIEAEGVDGR